MQTRPFALSAGLALAAAIASVGAGSASATPLPAFKSALETGSGSAIDSGVEHVQYRRGWAPGPRAYYAPRPYYAGPRYYAAPGWGYRPWYRRPYYGTIIAGVALGTIIGVTAYGLAPRAPRPDLCWYWADEGQSRGYWDYC